MLHWSNLRKKCSGVFIYIVNLLLAVFSTYHRCAMFYFLNGTCSNADLSKLFHLLVCHSVYIFFSIRFILVVMVILCLTPKYGFLLLYTHILTSSCWRSIRSILGNAIQLHAVILGDVTTRWRNPCWRKEEMCLKEWFEGKSWTFQVQEQQPKSLN